MSYEKHNFKSGDKLFAVQLNEMDEQIAENESNIPTKTSDLENDNNFVTSSDLSKKIGWDAISPSFVALKSTKASLGLHTVSESDIKRDYVQFPYDQPLVFNNIKPSVFYGLSQIAGDTTQKSSSNPVGQYTDEAKKAIQNMLGIETGGSGNNTFIATYGETTYDELKAAYDAGKTLYCDDIKTYAPENNVNIRFRAPMIFTMQQPSGMPSVFIFSLPYMAATTTEIYQYECSLVNGISSWKTITRKLNIIEEQ